MAQDEEQYIARAINNMKPYVDEIVIVDGGSKDNTVAICEELGCKVFHKPFEFHWANQRNYLFEMCENDWILMLDADEYFSDTILDRLQTFVKTGDKKNIACYQFRLETYFDEVLYSEGNVYTSRLMNKKGGTWSGQLHEVFQLHAECVAYRPPEEYIVYHKKTLKRQHFNNLLYQNIEQSKLERPPENLGLAMDNKQLLENDRNG